MPLYQHPTGTRREAHHPATTTPARAYRLLRELREAYTEQLYSWWNPEDLYLTCFGDFATRPTRKGAAPPPALLRKREQALEDRVGYEVPELLELMSGPELEQAARVLLEGTLPGFILHVLSQERTIQHRFTPDVTPAKAMRHTRRCDEGHAKAAGLGKGRPARKAPTRPVAQRQPVTPVPVARAVPSLRVAHSRAYWARERRRVQLALWPLGPGGEAVGL